ncbi:MAG: hypothetical protein FWF81_05075 [Defluviitaleaceae bacterium]|nr:hypothetical protein [Defluviitaleaceae bacterium]
MFSYAFAPSDLGADGEVLPGGIRIFAYAEVINAAGNLAGVRSMLFNQNNIRFDSLLRDESVFATVEQFDGTTVTAGVHNLSMNPLPAGTCLLLAILYDAEGNIIQTIPYSMPDVLGRESFNTVEITFDYTGYNVRVEFLPPISDPGHGLALLYLDDVLMFFCPGDWGAHWGRTLFAHN